MKPPILQASEGRYVDARFTHSDVTDRIINVFDLSILRSAEYVRGVGLVLVKEPNCSRPNITVHHRVFVGVSISADEPNRLKRGGFAAPSTADDAR